MRDDYIWFNELKISALGSGEEYCDGCGGVFISGSRAEGLTLENDWGHDGADVDEMYLHGGLLGVHVEGGKQPRGRSCLDFHPGGFPAYCKLEISDLDRFREGTRWFNENCVEESGNTKWLNTYNAIRYMKESDIDTRGDLVSGPASQDSKRNIDSVNTLVCSGPHPGLHHEFRRRTRGPWPTADVINYILRLPMLLVLVGHKLSSEFHLQARISWSHLEYKLIKELPGIIRQGYIACKYVMKRFLKIHRGQNEAADGRSHLSSYHIKTVFLHFLEKKSPITDHFFIQTVLRPFPWVRLLPWGG